MTKPAHTTPPPDAAARRRAPPVLTYSVEQLPSFDAAFYNTASNDGSCSTEYVRTGGALRRAAASGGGVVCAGFVILSVPQKVRQRRGQNTGHWLACRPFRSLGDRLALHNDDCVSNSRTLPRRTNGK